MLVTFCPSVERQPMNNQDYTEWQPRSGKRRRGRQKMERRPDGVYRNDIDKGCPRQNMVEDS